MELDINKPIMVYYIDATAKPRSEVDRISSAIIDMMGGGDFNLMVIPSDRSYIEIIWRGKEVELCTKEMIEEYNRKLESIETELDILESIESVQDIKYKIRKIRLGRL
jgi:hypothetical protein